MIGAIAAATAAGTGAATTAALGLKAATGIFSGLSSYRKAQGLKQDAEANAFIGRTRAIQTDTDARQGLDSELGEIRSALAANGQPQNVGTLEIMKDLRSTRDRERRINFANRMQESRSFSQQAQGYGQQARLGLVTNFARSGQSLFDLYQSRKKE